MRNEILRMERVTYEERGVLQLENFDLTLFAGEIVGLLPVSGHGLTGLIRLLRHNLPPNSGAIYYREERRNAWCTPRPRENQIGVIQSESSLVEHLTVADNIFVLRPGFRAWYLRPGLFRRQLQPVWDSLRIQISPDAYVEELSAFQRFVVELVKAVMAGSRLILLRDVSTFISESELNQFHAILRYYAAKGLAFLYIGYHTEELVQVCSRTAVFLRGRIAKVLSAEESRAYGRRFLGRKVSAEQMQPHPVLQVRHLTGGAVKELTFSVSSGECLVLQGLENHMFEDLLGIFSGERAIEYGEIWFQGKPFPCVPTRALAILNAPPPESMLFPTMSYFDNLFFTVDHRLPELWRSGRVQRGVKQAFGVPDMGLFDRRMEQLSETERFDLLYQRLLVQNPAVLLCIQPFKGADMVLRKQIRERLEQLMSRGTAVVILAVSLADTLSLANRLICVYKKMPDESCELGVCSP